MSLYDITIRAIVIKTLRVEAEDEDEAIMEAHSEFDVTCTDEREDYEEETLNIKEVTA